MGIFQEYPISNLGYWREGEWGWGENIWSFNKHSRELWSTDLWSEIGSQVPRLNLGLGERFCRSWTEFSHWICSVMLRQSWNLYKAIVIVPRVTMLVALVWIVIFSEEVPDPIKSELLDQLPWAKTFGQQNGLNMFPIYTKLTLKLDWGE